MSLDWNYRSVGPEGQAMIDSAWMDDGRGGTTSPALDSVIWATMAIGIGNWTKAAMPEVKRRMAIYQYLTGPAIRFNDGRAYNVTGEELDKLQGFQTNVSLETAAAFNKKAIRWLEENAARAMRKGLRQFMGEGGPDLEPIGAFEAQANANAKRAAPEADAVA